LEAANVAHIDESPVGGLLPALGSYWTTTSGKRFVQRDDSLLKATTKAIKGSECIIEEGFLPNGSGVSPECIRTSGPTSRAPQFTGCDTSTTSKNERIHRAPAHDIKAKEISAMPLVCNLSTATIGQIPARDLCLIPLKLTNASSKPLRFRVNRTTKHGVLRGKVFDRPSSLISAGLTCSFSLQVECPASSGPFSDVFHIECESGTLELLVQGEVQ